MQAATEEELFVLSAEVQGLQDAFAQPGDFFAGVGGEVIGTIFLQRRQNGAQALQKHFAAFAQFWICGTAVRFEFAVFSEVEGVGFVASCGEFRQVWVHEF